MRKHECIFGVLVLGYIEVDIFNKVFILVGTIMIIQFAALFGIYRIWALQRFKIDNLFAIFVKPCSN